MEEMSINNLGEIKLFKIITSENITDNIFWKRLDINPVSYTHLRAHETVLDLVCRLLLEKKTQKKHNTTHTHTHTTHIIYELQHQHNIAQHHYITRLGKQLTQPRESHAL